MVVLNLRDMNDLPKKIEALLFISGEGLTLHRLSTQLKKNDKEIEEALVELEKHLKDSHYITLLRIQDRLSLVTSPNASQLVEDFAKEEFSEELTKAAQETLTIVAYKGSIKRAEIDYIRGVNSSFMLRNLLMRGLVERKIDQKDTRSFVYRISPDFLKFLGITSISDLPEYGSVSQKLEDFLKDNEDGK